MENNKRETLRRGLARLVTPVDADDPEVHPLVGYQMELRRTLAAIRYYEEKIAETPEAEAFWGRTKEEEVNATEYEGVNVTHEAKTNVYIAAWERERAHLFELHKVWIAAKMDERRFHAEQQLVESVDEIVTAVVVGLGRNPRDPEVRNVVRQAMLSLKSKSAGTVPAINA